MAVKVIPSKNAKRRKKSFIKAIQNLKKKIFGELPIAVGDEVLEFKHVNVYKSIDAKRLLAIMNMNKTHFVTLEMLLHKGRMNVYDCLLLEFKGRLEPMVTNDTKATCASYSLAFIEHLITRTTIQPPQTLLCDYAVRRMQWVWDDGIVSKSLEP
ncbi:hypothetical protein H5410_021700 [Solanum commersonii]|uniref:Uncharacterized protein n=1 Tax=Solanum commersonii TaxID=4109 RepID=A0A9J5ZBR8_SOLCO|nr:hypothetical protein H5410_021700 [Solanum commersonii]